MTAEELLRHYGFTETFNGDGISDGWTRTDNIGNQMRQLPLYLQHLGGETWNPQQWAQNQIETNQGKTFLNGQWLAEGEQAPWGTRGLNFMDDNGDGWGYGNTDVHRLFDRNGRKRYRVGKDGARFFEGELGSKLKEMGLKDPASLIDYDPEHGWSIDNEVKNKIEPIQIGINGEGWTGMLPMLAMTLATGGIASLGAAGAAAGAGASAAGSGLSLTGNAMLDAVIQRAVVSGAMSGLTGGNPLTGALTGAITGGIGAGMPSLTGMPILDSAIKSGLSGAITSGIKGGNPLMGALTGAAGSGIKGLSGGLSKLFDANPLDISNPGIGQALTVNPLQDLRGRNMWADIYGELMGDSSGVLDLEGLRDVANNPLYADGDNADLSSLFPDPSQDQLDALLRQELFPDASQEQLDALLRQELFPDPSASQLAKLLAQESGKGSLDWRKLLGLGGTGGGGLSGLLGGGSGGLLGDGGFLGLAARLAPGLGALALAQSQGSVDTSPISNLLGNGAATFNSPFDTSKLNSLYGQVGDMTGRNTASALRNFDMRTGQARGELLGGLQRRGVMGSSFGNMDIGNFDTQSQNQRGMLEGQLGLQGLAAQSGLANNMLGAEQSQRQQQLGYLGQQGTVASQLLNAQLQQKAIQSALYGRAFDILGRAVSPTPSIYGR